MKGYSAEDQGCRRTQAEVVRMHMWERGAWGRQLNASLQSKAPTGQPGQLFQGAHTPSTEQWGCFYQTRPRKKMQIHHTTTSLYTPNSCLTLLGKWKAITVQVGLYCERMDGVSPGVEEHGAYVFCFYLWFASHHFMHIFTSLQR